MERDNLALELRFLKSQINPHFLFNTLNSIYSRTVDVDEQASEMVLKLSDLMRYGLYSANEERVPLLEELEYIQNYLDLEKYRRSESLVDISFTREGNSEGLNIAPLLMISLVENAFKHAINISRMECYVHVTSVVKDNSLLFTVRNSLPVRPAETPEAISSKKSGGIGLTNMGKRLELLYPDRHSLQVEMSAEQFTAILRLELASE